MNIYIPNTFSKNNHFILVNKYKLLIVLYGNKSNVFLNKCPF